MNDTIVMRWARALKKRQHFSFTESIFPLKNTVRSRDEPIFSRILFRRGVGGESESKIVRPYTCVNLTARAPAELDAPNW